jgi:plasmid stabilization system protein ParE
MSVSISREAEIDLAAIADYIALDSPMRAVLFVQDIVDACGGLDGQPLRHPLTGEYSRPLRRFAYRGYTIYYEVRGGARIL